MPSFRDLYPARWIKPEIIGSKRVRVMVECVTRESLFNPTTKKNEDKLIAKFRDKELRLILNQTQCRALEKIFQVDDYTRWHGREIILSTAKASNGKDTIVIGAPSEHEQTPNPQREPEREPAQDNPFEDEDTGLDEQGDVNYYTRTPEKVSARLDTPGNVKVRGQELPAARPLNEGSGPCPACHAPVGKMHTIRCTAMQNDSGARSKTPENVGVHGQEVTPEKVAARPAGAPAAKTFEQEVFDFDAEVYQQMATLYDSNLPLSSELTEFMRKARNSDHDSAMKMSTTYLKALTTTLQSTLTISEDEAYMLLTALVGYRIDGAGAPLGARPGQLVHGYILKPLRDNSEVVVKCLKELSDVCLTIYSDMMDSASSPQVEWVANEQ